MFPRVPCRKTTSHCCRFTIGGGWIGGCNGCCSGGGGNSEKDKEEEVLEEKEEEEDDDDDKRVDEDKRDGAGVEMVVVVVVVVKESKAPFFSRVTSSLETITDGKSARGSFVAFIVCIVPIVVLLLFSNHPVRHFKVSSRSSSPSRSIDILVLHRTTLSDFTSGGFESGGDDEEE